jgi:hypothetical protein
MGRILRALPVGECESGDIVVLGWKLEYLDMKYHVV